MTRAFDRDLRLVLVIRTGEEEEARRMISLWRDAFSQLAPDGLGFCLWVTGVTPAAPKDLDACVHTLRLNPLIDGYRRDAREQMTWSPWGQKSGPNYQFFKILSMMPQLHKEQWLLQLELDTFPLRKVNRSDLSCLFDSDEYWVGGTVSQKLRKRGSSHVTPEHINGAAFYKFGDPEFIEFLNQTWAPSMIHILRRRPALAYDVVNSPANTETLPTALKNQWSSNRHRFLGLAGMGINVTDHRDTNKLDSATAVGHWFTHQLGTAHHTREEAL